MTRRPAQRRSARRPAWPRSPRRIAPQRTTHPGGAATVNGVLYQILGTLSEATELHLKSLGDHRRSPLITLEPKGGGGDLRTSTGRGRHIQQWKARQGAGTWSLKEVLDEVIPDLYRGVLDTADERDTYSLKTEGRIGTWTDFYDRLPQLPASPDALDAREIVGRIGRHGVTARGALTYALEHLPRDGRSKRERTNRALHVLRHFRIEQVSFEDLERSVDRLLLLGVSSRDELPALRDRLNGALLPLLSRGDQHIVPAEFFAAAGLNLEAVQKLRDFAKLKADADRLLVDALKDNYKYDAASNVRTPPSWPQGKPVLILSGESGQGKSWQLAALLEQRSRAGDLVVLCPRSRGADRDVQFLADRIWGTMLSHDTMKPFERVVDHLRLIFHDAIGSPLVAIDDISDVDSARDLIALDWPSWGVQLALVVSSPMAARALARQYPERIAPLPIADFELAGVRRLLAHNGRRLAEVPEDLWPTLRRPLLTSLYCQLGSDVRWHPTREYEFFQRFWEDQLRLAGTQSAHLVDESRLAALAASILDGATVYPWTFAHAASLGCDEAALTRLERVGWLRLNPGGTVEVAHDRLLCWAVAVGLVRNVQERRMTLAAAGEHLALMLRRETRYSGRSLGYTPMDFLWIACHPDSGISAPDLVPVLQRVSSEMHARGHFISETLPTLGPRLLPALSEWIRRETSGSEMLHYVPRALRVLSRDAPEDVRRVAVGLITHADAWMQLSAVRLLATIPDPAMIDPLWALLTQLPEPPASRDLSLRSSTFRALAASLNSDPAWLSHRIVTDSADPARAELLGYLIAELDSDDAAALWRRHRSLFVAALGNDSNRARALLRCAQRFGDDSLLPRVREWLREPGSILAASAMGVLSQLAPDEAVAAIDDTNARVLSHFRSWWLDELLRTRPQATLAAIMSRLRRDLATDLQVGDIVSGYDAVVTVEILDSLLDNLEQLLDTGEGATEESSRHIGWALQQLSGVSRLDLVSAVHRRAGSALEARLTAFLLPQLAGDHVFRDHALDEGLRLLLLIGGEGIRRVLDAGLDPAAPPERGRAALMWALLGEPGRDRLREIAAVDPGSDDSFGSLRTRALHALLVADDVDVTISAVVRWGRSAAEKARYWRPERPFTDAELEHGFARAASSPDAGSTRVLLLGVSSRRDAARRITEELREGNTSLELTRAALFALSALRASDAAVLPLLRRALEDDATRLSAIETVVALDRPTVRRILARFLAARASGTGRPTQLDLDSIWSAYPIAEVRPYLARILWRYITAGDLPFGDEGLVRCLGSLPDADVTAYLWERAAGDGPHAFGGWQTRMAALEALAEIDPIEAFTVADACLRAPRGDKAPAARVLLTCDASLAFPILFEYIAEETEGKKRWALERLLRPYRERIEEALGAELGSPQGSRRAAAAEIAGWLGVGALADELRRLSWRDPAPENAAIAFEALRRQGKERCVQELIAALPSAPPLERWALVEAITTMGDPELLLAPGDASSLVGGLGAALSPDVVAYAEERIQDRRREVESEAWHWNARE